MRLNRNDPLIALLIEIGYFEELHHPLPGSPPLDEALILKKAEAAAKNLLETPSYTKAFIMARAALHLIGGGGRREVPVERVECVDWSQGYEQPADPLWRIELNGYCADFPSEQAARNFASQIGAAPAGRGAAEAVLAIVAGDPEEPEAIRPLSWLEEAVRELKERGPAEDCEDRDAYHTMVGEVRGLLDSLKAALEEGGTP